MVFYYFTAKVGAAVDPRSLLPKGKSGRSVKLTTLPQQMPKPRIHLSDAVLGHGAVLSCHCRHIQSACIPMQT